MTGQSSGSAQPGLVQKVNARFFYGWIIVGVAAAGVFSSGPGQSHTFSAFIEPISNALDISSAQIATAYGLATLIAAFALPYMGRLVDRYGPRRMMFIIAGAVGLACLFFAASPNFVWLAIGFGLLRFFGQGSLMLVCANLVSQWFSRARGVAMSLMALGFGLSMAIHPPLSQFLIDWLGWRNAWIVLSGLTWGVMLPAIWFLVHNTPESVGLKPDGEIHDESTAADTKPDAPILGLTLAEALRTSTFYIMAAGWFAIAMLVTTLHFYQVTILTDQGLSRDNAASIFTVSAITMVVTMPFVGRAFDTIKTRYVIAAALFLTASSLVLITFATSIEWALVYAVCFGVNNALSMTMFGYVWPRYFGRKHLGSVQGAGQLVATSGASLGPLPVGIAYDLVGNAGPTLIGLAILPAIAGLVTILFLRTPGDVGSDPKLE